MCEVRHAWKEAGRSPNSREGTSPYRGKEERGLAQMEAARWEQATLTAS
jgi:hypothetical protein